MSKFEKKIYLFSDPRKPVGACTAEKAMELFASGVASTYLFTRANPFLFVESVEHLRMQEGPDLTIFPEDLNDTWDACEPEGPAKLTHKPLNNGQISDLLVQAGTLTAIPPEMRTLENYYEPMDEIRAELANGIPGMTDPPPKTGPVHQKILQLGHILDNAYLTCELDSIDTIRKVQALI